MYALFLLIVCSMVCPIAASWYAPLLLHSMPHYCSMYALFLLMVCSMVYPIAAP